MEEVTYCCNDTQWEKANHQRRVDLRGFSWKQLGNGSKNWATKLLKHRRSLSSAGEWMRSRLEQFSSEIYSSEAWRWHTDRFCGINRLSLIESSRVIVDPLQCSRCWGCRDVIVMTTVLDRLQPCQLWVVLLIDVTRSTIRSFIGCVQRERLLPQRSVFERLRSCFDDFWWWIWKWACFLKLFQCHGIRVRGIWIG